MYKLGTRSISNLVGVHPDLQKVMYAAITNSPHDFTITEGVRSQERQKFLYDDGKSLTMISRHLTGHAIDLAVLIDGKVNWTFSYYEEVAEHIEKVAASLSIPITWGGRWRGLRDGPHFELDKKVYK
jgi:peptidoglycan LD-endopeptidase CwlK